MATLSYSHLTNLHHELLPAWLDLYETAFPPVERLLVSFFLKVLRAKEEGRATHTQLLAMQVDGSALAGMGVYALNPEERAAMLWYLAVNPELRSQGLGAQIYQEIFRQAQEQSCPRLIYEVEIPDHCETPAGRALAERRIAFYRRQGAQLLTGIHYLQSVGSHQPETPMHLMVHATEPISPPEVFALAQSIFDDAVSQVGDLGLS